MTMYLYRVTGRVTLSNGKTERFATMVEATSSSDAIAKGKAEAYHMYGTQNILRASLNAYKN